MIVTAGAADGESEERRPDRVHRVALPFGAILIAVVGELDWKRAEREQARADAPVDVLHLLLRQLERALQVHAGGPQLVSRDLLLDERVVPLVLIERVDHPVA